jgi:hypothetical protein
METEVLHPGSSYAAISPDEQQKVRGIVKEKYLATLFLDRSDKKHQELKDDVKNNYAKGNKNAFPPTISMAMQLMQEYRNSSQIRLWYQLKEPPSHKQVEKAVPRRRDVSRMRSGGH